jgi:anti-sigma regulatory factor (Ser/Thr protein kinase)
MITSATHEVELAAHPASVRSARKFFVAIASTQAVDADDVLLGELAVGELVTNAVLHAGGPIYLRLRAGDGVLRVDVADPSPMPLLCSNHDPRRPGGRGLTIVASVASTWGSDRADSGKSVWFTLPLLQQ